ncbi:MAG: NADH-quinone oxidoreductase subunit J [Anaerolineales bacterium]|jgi:NADH-quinone oxidoreductase subunit J|nr:NADH-quinone oxidoreductase subunit J [Anaerolineales bacterium]
MLIDWIIFFGLAVVAIASGIGLLLSKNAIYAALNLIANFTAVAIFYLILAAPFIALAQIAVYAGAIMVLFLFVIMLLGAERLGGTSTLRWQRPLAIMLGLILIVETVLVFINRSGAIAPIGEVTADFGSPAAIGESLFSTYLLPFEVISVLLLAAMIGAIVLTRRRDQKA